jgi:hypothetical protein
MQINISIVLAPPFPHPASATAWKYEEVYKFIGKLPQDHTLSAEGHNL